LLHYVCIDEFQGFSDLFYRLLNAIRKQNPRIELFCVGDDWQAINGFAGSDLRFFENFADHIGESRRLYISTNYRSSKAIVAVGNALMDGLGKPAIAHKKSDGKVLVADLTEFKPSLLEQQRRPGDIITPAVLRLTSKALADGLDVVMLCRRNAIPWFVNNGDGRGLARYLDLIRSFFPKGLKERISISTAHKYKGLEKPMVIVLDAVARSYPLIHPDWAFSRILGDSPEKIAKEERRLLYVALTRAVDTLVIITDGRSKSPFLEELEPVLSHMKNPIKLQDTEAF
jgi:DNA helicase IV